jgi:lipoyl(octanoyl) transferase
MRPINALRAVRELGHTDYLTTLYAMQSFTRARNANTPDELWLTEHAPVYTLGLGATEAHVLDAGEIPVVRTDRGGQVTYHGPGQVVAYLLLDLRRSGLKVKELVNHVESAVITTLQSLGVTGERVAGRPGVYVGGAKIAALGLKVKGGCTYHGVSLNVAMDLQPFTGINPCGYAGLEATDLATLGVDLSLAQAGHALAKSLAQSIKFSGAAA